MVVVVAASSWSIYPYILYLQNPKKTSFLSGLTSSMGQI